MATIGTRPRVDPVHAGRLETLGGALVLLGQSPKECKRPDLKDSTMPTTRTTIAFAHPFHIAGLDAGQPAGRYVVDVDEEPIDGLTFMARRRVGAILYVPAGSDPSSCRYAVPMTIGELDAAIALKAK